MRKKIFIDKNSSKSNYINKPDNVDGNIVTKPVEFMSLNEEILKKIQQYSAEQQCILIEDWLKLLVEKFNELLKNDWLKIKNKDVYYNNKVCGLLPNLKNFNVGISDTRYYFDKKSLKMNFEGFSGKLMNSKEIEDAFINYTKIKIENLFKMDFENNFSYYNVKDNIYEYKNWNRTSRHFNNYYYDGNSYSIPIFHLITVNEKLIEETEVLLKLMSFNLIPQGLNVDEEKKYVFIMNLYKKNVNYFTLTNDIIQVNNNLLLGEFLNGDISYVDRKIAINNDIQKDFEEKSNITWADAKKMIKEKLLFCDKVRCDLEPYEEAILTNPQKGHWDLWDYLNNKDEYSIKVDEILMARNPALDIRSDGVIGIDFGTKSTVVVYQENSDKTIPMRIGTGQLGKKVETHHYENPTVLEFINLEQFFYTYQEKIGRPETLWDHLTTSHTAFSDLVNSKSEDFYSFIYELKQWAGDKTRLVRLRDKEGTEIVLKSFLDINEKEFNPIEIYAYFIGLYINNMRNGIYLDYLLSFPVTYEKAVRDKILLSFNNGIKKSLPISILNEKKYMDKFRITAGASEPAAYAICALQEYKFEPELEEKIFYGVFDFGGGTTDFDFGLWREANEDEKRYDYVLECFGAGGDQFLGGENLLELLAFEVYKKNQELLRELKISFVRPQECERFLGDELLVDETQESKLNMTKLMQWLRMFWERHENYEDIFEKGVLKVDLIDRNKEKHIGVELSIDSKELNEILYKRIEKGVRNFFEGLRLAFKDPSTKDISCVNIFLAGNSSKSPILEEVFEKYIELYTEKFSKDDNKNTTLFKLYPPLGTEKAIELQVSSIGGNFSSENVGIPTGKTGVAFGLIDSRPGAKIKIIQKNNTKDKDEVKFKYYIGYEKKGKFRVLSDKELLYGEWKLFIDACECDFTIYYSNLPEASSNIMKIKDVSRKKCCINKKYADANIYYRAISPTAIEYVVAKPIELEQEIYLENQVVLELS